MNKHLICLITFVSLIFFQLSLSGEEKAVYQGTAEVVFFGTSTFHDFSGKGHSKQFAVYTTRDENTFGWTVEILIEQLATENQKLNKAMYRMFDTDAFPIIKGYFNRITFKKAKDVPFELTIRNMSNTVLAQLTNVEENESALTFTLEFDVSLKDFHLKPPSLLGIIKVGDRVKVKNYFVLTKQ